MESEQRESDELVREAGRPDGLGLCRGEYTFAVSRGLEDMQELCGGMS